MTVGIFGGSFDPIHNGHVSLAKFVLDHTDLDEVWLMVSPLNPLKPQGYVASDGERLEMARLAVRDIPGIKVSDFEFNLPVPSFTYKTLTELKKAYTDIDFRLIIGGDNWTDFGKWKNPDKILNEFGLIVYPRPGESLTSASFPVSFESSTETSASSPLTLDSSKILILDSAPQMPVSSTEIRRLLASRQPAPTPEQSPSAPASTLQSLNPKVLDYIRSHHLYTS